MPEHVSHQVTDAVSQVNVQVLGEAPAMAMGSIYQTAAHSTGLMFQNAVNSQNNQFILAQTATAQGVRQLYSMDTMANAISIAKLIRASGNF